MKLFGSLFLVFCISIFIFGCSSGTSQEMNSQLSVEELAQSDTGKSCFNVQYALKENYPQASIDYEILPDLDMVKCRIQMKRNGKLYFSIVHPTNQNTGQYEKYDENRKEYRENLSATSSSFISSGRTGTCSWITKGYMSKLVLEWPAATNPAGGSDCSVGNAPPDLQHGYELIKGEFIFP